MSTHTSKLQNSNDKVITNPYHHSFNKHSAVSSAQEVQAIWEARKKFNLKLVEEYQKEECLWNVNSEKFFNIAEKKPAWLRIVANMGKDVPLDLVKHRIFTMRYQLQNAGSKDKSSKSLSVTKSKLYFAKPFSFLNEMKTNRRLLHEKMSANIIAMMEDSKVLSDKTKKESNTLPSKKSEKETNSVKPLNSTRKSNQKPKEEKSVRPSAGKQKPVRKTTSSKSSALPDLVAESYSSSKTSMTSKTSYKSAKSSPRPKVLPKPADSTSSIPLTWYTPPSGSKSSLDHKGYPWVPLKFKSKSTLLRSSFRVAKKVPADANKRLENKEESLKKEVNKTQMENIHTPDLAQLKSVETKLDDDLLDDLLLAFEPKKEKKSQSKVKPQVEKKLKGPNSDKQNISTPKVEKFEEDDKRFFDKLYEPEAEKQVNKTSKTKNVNEPKARSLTKLENYLKSIKSPATNIIKNLNDEKKA